MGTKYIIGCDIGTSGTKSVLFKLDGTPVASRFCGYPLYSYASGWAEQDADDWYNAVCKTVRELLNETKIDCRDVASVGFSGQMHGLVMLDASGKPLRKSIIWCDQRTQTQVDYIEQKIGAERLIALTSNVATCGFTLSKLLWVKNNESELFSRAAHVLLPKDYVVYRLTGELSTDTSDASGTGMFNVSKREWCDELLREFEIPRMLLPAAFEGYEVVGKISVCAARESGLAEGTCVCAGGGDQACAAIGNGIVKSGLVGCNLGTSGVVFAPISKPASDNSGRAHVFCHADGGWHIMGVTQACCMSVSRLSELHFASYQNPYEAMEKALSQTPIGANGLVYLPYLMGERTPHLDADARGVLFGIEATHTSAHIARAVYEGVSYSLLDCLNIIRNQTAVNEIRLSGGGSNSREWRQMLADVFNAPVCVTETSEAGALGAAILAGVSVGAYKSVAEACELLVKVSKTLQPIAENAEKYQRNYVIYKELYPSLRAAFKLRSKLYD